MVKQFQFMEISVLNHENVPYYLILISLWQVIVAKAQITFAQFILTLQKFAWIMLMFQ